MKMEAALKQKLLMQPNNIKKFHGDQRPEINWSEFKTLIFRNQNKYF